MVDFPVARRLVNLQQASALICVSRRTLYHWMAENKVEWIQTAGSGHRIYEDTLLRRVARSSDEQASILKERR